MSLTTKLLSGIEINQNRSSTGVALDSNNLYQNFRLPSNWTRGSISDERHVAEMSGFSVFVTTTTPEITVLDWSIERYLSGSDWLTLKSGVAVGASGAGTAWFDVFFDEIIQVEEGAVNDADFRLVFKPRTNGGYINVEVPYSSGKVTLGTTRLAVALKKGVPHLFDYEGFPSILYQDPATNKVWLSRQQQPTSFSYGIYTGAEYQTAYTDLATITTPVGERRPLTFRIFTATGDDGTDTFGNPYRHALHTHGIENVTTVDGAVEDRYWMSKPNPSQFAIENQFFDLSQSGSPTTIDSVLVDPVTPDVYFHIYYSSEGEPGTTPEEWDAKLWTRIPRSYQAKRRDTHAFPEPIRARYTKIEYTQLQPRSYRPGPFQQPIRYYKHPKWVLDYFLLRLEQEREADNRFLARSVTVNYNALDLAYNYYLDDIGSAPAVPVNFDPRYAQSLTRFYQSRKDTSDLIDSQTLDRINFALNPYRTGSFISRQNSLLFDLVGGTGWTATELGRDLFRNAQSDVSSLNRDAVVFEQSFPVMFFHLTCRHHYRVVEAQLRHNRAYFVGTREVAWMRENYTKATDTAMYIEIGGDSVNLQSNDFIHDDTSLAVG